MEVAVAVDRFNCIECYGGSEGYFVRATIRGHHAQRFPRIAMVRDCEYLCEQPCTEHQRRITCFQVDLTAYVRREGVVTGATRLRAFLDALDRLGIQLPERQESANAVPLSNVIAYINILFQA